MSSREPFAGRTPAGLDPWAVAAALLGLLLTVAIGLWYRAAAAATPTFVGQGFPLDDAWIHAQFALNAAGGRLLEYNPGVPSSGSTSPLWSLLLAPALLVLGDPVAAAHGVGLLVTALMVALAVRLASRLGVTGPCLLAVPVLVASQWRIAWASVSGMEVNLVGLLVLATFHAYLGERERDRVPWRTAVLAGLTFWGRPEGLAAIAVLTADQLLLLGADRELPFRRRTRRLVGLLALWAAVASPLMAWNLAHGPGIFPQTLYAKQQLQSLERGWSVTWQLFADVIGGSVAWQVFLAGAFFTVARHLVDWRTRLSRATPGLFLLAWFAGIALFRGSGDYHARYLMPCIGLLLVLALDGLRRALAATRLGVAGLVTVMAALVWDAAPELRAGAATYGLNVASVSGHVVAMGRWARRHVPPDSVLAMSDVGAISYFTDNRVLDMRGLVSPYFGWDRLAELERQRREGVDYAMLFPELNERVVLRGGYQPIHAITLEANNISATDNLVAYRTPWSDPRRLEPVGASFDFEDGGLDGWLVEGSLAGPPARGAGAGQRPVVNLGGGERLLSSWAEPGGAEHGRALSPPFAIEGDIVTLRVGGGDDPGALGVRLWVDGAVARTAVGCRSDVLVQREWDVRELRGRTGRLEVRDEATGAWGHILVDEVRQHRVLAGEPPALVDFPAEGPTEPEASRRAAERRGLGLGALAASVLTAATAPSARAP